MKSHFRPISNIFPDDFVHQYRELKSEPNASAHSRTNVENWLRSHEGAIEPAEATYIQNHDDLFSIKAIQRTPLRKALEKFDSFYSIKYFQRDVPNNKSEFARTYDPRTTTYQADQRINHLVTVVICVTGFFALVVPLWILLFVHSRTIQLAVITVCIAFFLATIQSVTVARPFESLAATAA